MRLIIVTVHNGLASVYKGPKRRNKQAKLDEEAQFLELKLATNNPQAKENLEFWKKEVEERKFYGLLVVVDQDRNIMDCLPLMTKEIYDKFLTKEEWEHMQEKKE